MEMKTDAGGTATVLDEDGLTPHELAAFLDGRLAGEELARVESYLADHPSARQELIKASRITQSAPAREVKQPRRFYPLIGLVAAAAIVLVLARPNEVNPVRSPVSTERRGIGDEPEQIVVVSPMDAGEVKDRSQPLTWHALQGATYRVFIADASGNSVFMTSTSDTSLVLPETVRAGATYYWSVDARTPDGSSSTSGYHEFRLIGR